MSEERTLDKKSPSLAWLHSRVTKAWYNVRSSYWFIPVTFALIAVALAFAVAYLDRTLVARDWLSALPPLFRWAFDATEDSARSVLETIAGGMISVAAVAYSMLLVVLTLASSQYGPRILQLFKQDRKSQTVLGLLVALTAYCLVLLNVVGSAGPGPVVPRIGILIAFMWGLLNLGAFVQFFHHVAESIQAPMVIAAIGQDVERLTASLPAETSGERDRISAADALAQLQSLPSVEVEAPESGYIQVIDLDALTTLADEQGIGIRLLGRAGDWKIKGAPLATLYGDRLAAGDVDDEILDGIQGAIVTGDRRTPIQDFEFGIYQLEEVALRALSPAMNDPHTAITCIDELGSVLTYLAHHFDPNVVEMSEDDRPLLIREVTSFEGLVDAAFNNIRGYGADQVPVVIRVLETIDAMVPLCKNDDQRQVLLHHADMVAQAALNHVEASEDRDDIKRRLQALQL
jgi:uncharacterized membrane protein